jgi:tetratricopeptide (TPR) repeat protein
MRHFALAIALSLVALLAPRRALGQAELDERARTHFQAGTSYFEAAQYEDALREFEQAYRLSNRVGLLYNLSISHERLSHWREAADFLEQYIQQRPDLDNREVLELKIRNLRERAERAETGTDTDTDTGSGSDMGSDSGAVPNTDTDSSTDSGTGTATGESTGGGVPVPAIVAYVAGGVGAILWATFGVLAIAEDSRLATDCAAIVCTNDDVGTLRAFDAVADIGFALTLTGAALGTIFLLTMRDQGNGESRAAIAPWLGPTSGGVSVGGRL